MRLALHRRQAAFAAPLLATYTQPTWWQNHRVKLIVLLIGFAFVYGAAFGLTTTYFLLQLMVPLVILAAAVVWLLPESDAPPVGLLSKLLFAFLIVLLVWPDYLAITLPGMPWITAVRLTGTPMALVLLVCVSVSSEVRRNFAETLAAAPWVWKLLLGFLGLAVLSIAISTDIAFSINKFTAAAVNWFVIFFVALYVFRTPGRMFRLAYTLWGIAIVVSLIGIVEWRNGQVPWAGRIPSFLAIQDETVQRILTGAARSATGIYRVQSKFTTPLGLAEFYALVTPFVLHLAFRAPRLIVRMLAAVTLPFIFWMILLTDSRLGVVGFLLACILYVAVWAVWQSRREQGGLIGQLVLLSYPMIFTAFVAATFLVARLRAIAWGNGPQSASNEGRRVQLVTGIPKIFDRPWGYGMGRGGEALGFTNLSGVLTIDNYYLSIALDFGVLGFIVYYSMFLNGIWNGARRLYRTNGGENDLIAPVTIALINFFVIKSIFSQQDNHSLVFALLGALVALCWRVDYADRARLNASS